MIVCSIGEGDPTNSTTRERRVASVTNEAIPFGADLLPDDRRIVASRHTCVCSVDILFAIAVAGGRVVKVCGVDS